MQAALDSTALMLSKTAGTINQSQLQQTAQNLFFANFNRPEAQNVQVAATYAMQSSGAAVTVSASAQIPTKIMGSVGRETVVILK